MSRVVQLLAVVHLLSGAAWFGALVCRTFFVDPKSMRFFERGGDYEQFALHLADGMRAVVTAALLVCGLSGFALLGLRWTPAAGWLSLMAVKGVVWLAAFVVFVYISWVYWPRRVFAAGAEVAALRRQGLALALVMIALAGSGIVLGQAARSW